NQQIKELKKLTQLCGNLFEKGKALLKKENLLALQNQENKILHQVQNMNKLGRWELDLKTNDLSRSKEVYDIHELPLNTDITKTKGINFYHPSFKDQLHNALENCIINGEAFQIECLLITHKNNHKWVRSTGWKVDNKVTGSFQDITVIKERELKFKGIFNSTFAFLGFLNTDGILVEVNQAMLSFAGLSHSDVIGKYFWDCYWWQISKQAQKELQINFQKALAGELVEYEVEIWSANKTPAMILFSLKPIFDDNGNVIYVIPEGRNIQDIVHDKRRFKAILDGANLGTWEWNVPTGEIVFNDRWAEIIGYSTNDFDGTNAETWLNLMHPEDVESSNKILQQCFENNNEFYEVEIRMKHKNGHWIWMLVRGKVIQWTNEGKPLMMFGTQQDISLLKEKDELLRISEQAFRGNFENAAIGMALLDESGKWLKVNSRIPEMLGYTEQELLSLTFQDITYPEDLDIDLNYLNELIEGKRSRYQMEKRYYHKQGHLVYAILAVSMVKDSTGNILYFVSQIIDITTFKNQQLELEYQQTLFSKLYELSPIGIALNDFETGQFLDVNQKLLQPTGYTKEEFLALNYFEVTPEKYMPLEEIALQQMNAKGSYDMFEKEYIRKDGSRYPVSLVGVLIKDNRGKKLIWSFIQDISIEKQAKLKLNQAISKLQAVLDASNQVSIIATDTSGIISLFNAGAEKTLGYKADEVVGKETPLIIHLPDEVEKESQRLSEKYNQKITGFNTFIFEANKGKPTTSQWSYKTKEGKIIPILLSVNTIKVDHSVVGYLGVATDISQLKKKEEEINNLLKVSEEQNNRLKNFAHIVSHNLRSHSAGISGLLSLLEVETAEIVDNEYFNLFKQASFNLEKTVEDLTKVVTVNLYQKKFESIQLHQIIQKNIESLASLIRKSEIQIHNNVPPDTIIEGVPAYIDSISLNFISNAIKYRSEQRDSFLNIYARKENKYCILSFEDNGLGIDLDSYGDKIFGLYKTFHKNKDSRGVGLFMTKNQVESMGGKIEVTSNVNHGTTFKVYLPLNKS
ncbi:MAG: PAS domain S-box protein, partial [Flavobacteriaceae bacterium]|nr:PAS domain S-box protein [Flavobacteriaceae bacterium]